MSFERKLSKEAYFIFKMTAPTGQFGLLVSALSWHISLNFVEHMGVFLCQYLFFFLLEADYNKLNAWWFVQNLKVS